MWSDLRGLARFELGRAVARPGARMGVVLCTLILAMNHFEAWMGRTPSGGLFGAAYAIGLIGVMCFGLTADRRLRFDTYLFANHIRPRTYLAAKAVAMCGVVLLYGCVTGAIEMVFSAGAVSLAGWSAVALTLTAFLIVPLAMLVESFADTAMPAAFVMIAFAVAVVSLYLGRGTLGLLDATGLSRLEPGDWSSVGPLALNVAIGAMPATVLVVMLLSLKRPRC